MTKQEQPNNGLNEYRQFLIDTQIKLRENYDKLLVTLSGGSLALSITYLKDIIGSNNIQTPLILLAAWTFFVCSLAAILCEILFGIKAYEKAVNQVDEETIYKEITGGKSAKLSVIMHWTSAICLLLGLIFLSTFAFFNIGEKNATTKAIAKATTETTSKTSTTTMSQER